MGTLNELPNPGHGGSHLYKSKDGRFIIKSVQSKEMPILLDLLPNYYTHLKQNPRMLLSKLFGLFELKVMIDWILKIQKSIPTFYL